MFRMTALFVVERNKVQLLAELFKLLKLSAQASRHASLASGSRGGATRGTQHNPNFQLQVLVFGGVMLCCGMLSMAVLRCAVLCCAVLCCAVLCHTVQGYAVLGYARQMMLQTCRSLTCRVERNTRMDGI